MSNYIKKYDVGNIAIDLPYNSFIHELPILRFKDFRNSVNISLIFNQKLKIDGDNSFNVGKGYKLNIHKRIIFENNIPVKLMESNGKYVLLNRNKNSQNVNSTVYNNIYTFDDDSRRILRVKSRLNTETNTYEKYYEIENDDFSREEYNSLGYLHFVYDKYDDVYLEYHYENNLLIWVKYASKDNYKVSFEYYNNELTSISYGGTTTTLVYDEPDLTVIHYSGVIYYITVTDTKFTVKGRGNEDTGLYYRIKECTYYGNSITLTYKEGTTELDRLLYTFPSSVTDGYKSYDYAYITNKNYVEQRIQFNGNKPLYSYEVNYDYDEVQFNDDKCTSNVVIYNTLNNPHPNLFKGTLKFTDGIRFIENQSFNNCWEVRANTDNTVKNTYLLTGWAKSSTISGNHSVNVSNSIGNPIYTFDIPINKANQWHFFAYQFEIEADYIHVYPVNSNLEFKDLRVMYRATDLNEDKKNIFVSLQEDILIDNLSNSPVLFKDVVFEYETEGCDSGVINMTFSDVLRYMKRKIKSGYCSELYYENCKKVITDLLWLKVYINGSTDFKYIDDYDVGFLQYRNGKQYDTRIQKYNSTTSPLVISNNKDKSYYSYQYLNEYFDVKEDHYDGIDTYYTRDKGLITKEEQEDNYNITYTYNTTNNTLIVNDLCNNYFMTSDVTYYMDPIWGTMYKKQMSNGTKIEDTYDDDMSIILEKEFNKQTLGIHHLFGYNKGNLTSLSCDTLNYTFGYTKDKISQVTKFSSTIEERVHTDDASIIYYPSQASAVYNEHYVYDKYNRIKSITNVLENTYNAFSKFNESTGAPNENFDTINSKLVMCEDKIKSQKSRFHYNPEGTLSNVEVSDSTDYSNKISNETFTYDDANRLLSKEFVYNTSSNGSVKDEFTYVKSADDPHLDGVINSSKYIINDSEIVNTTNTYSNKKVDIKTYKFGNKSVTKDFGYSFNKVNNETNSIFGTSSSTTYTYDTFDRLSSITSNGKTITYEYDIYNRLIRENNQSLDKTIVYEYNDIGNITTKKEYDYSTSGLSNLRSTKSYSYDSTYKDRLVNYNGTTIPYNVLGCPTNLNGYSLTWNKGKLTGLSKGNLQSGTESYTYTYNAYGQRASKTYSKMPGTSGLNQFYSGEVTNYIKTYNYDNSGRLIREVTTNTYYQEGTGTEEIVYIYDVNTIIGMKYNNGYNSNTYYFDRNVLGDVDAIYDLYGNLKVKYLYDAYGNCTISSETTDQILARVNPIRYRGYYYDVETGLFYCNSRYYNPEWGRWISPDDIEYLDPESVNGLNLYCYCGNDPINRIDPTGHDWWHWAAAAVIVVLLAAGLVVTAGGVAPAYGAAMAALYGVASTTVKVTVASYAFVGASLALAGSAMYALGTSSSLDEFAEQGNLGTIINTAGGGIFGAFNGAYAFYDQIGSESQAAFMTPAEKTKQRQAIVKANPGVNFKGLELSHDYGTYGNNRNFYSFKTYAEHRGPGGFHSIYGYKTNGGPFHRPYPYYYDWLWFMR